MKILVVGAGQSGLQLSCSLAQRGYDVTVMTARSPEEIRAGRVMSTQCMFDSTLQHERDEQLNLWEEETPNVEGIGLVIGAPGGAPDGRPIIDWSARLDAYAQSVDQRIKMAGWLEHLENLGGKVILHGVTTNELDDLCARYDLVIIAAGKGELVGLFDRDPARSSLNPTREPFSSPQRILSLAYVHGLRPREGGPQFTGVEFNVAPGVGELFMIPALTLTGPCDILFFEGIPGGPLDCWDTPLKAEDHFQRILELIREYIPWQYERCADVELTDSRATLAGAYTPVVRQPIGRLPGGGSVLGMADVVVANDPITGQGSNNAARCAAIYLDAIDSHAQHEDATFDDAWKQRTFDRYWDYAKYVTEWTNAMLMPPPEHVLNLLGAAGQFPQIASRFVNGFTDPKDFQDWFLDPEKAQQYLACVTGAAPPEPQH
jgi:hypothetical protein